MDCLVELFYGLRSGIAGMQNEKKPFLTIGIPTWNRFPFLKKNVESIIEGLVKHKINTVEVLVCDNASTDETESFCEAQKLQLPFFTYYRHPRNMGANFNFYSVMEKGAGEYIWLVGDDDLLVTESFIHILEDLENYKPAVCVGTSLNDTDNSKANLHFLNATLLTDRSIFKKTDVITLASKMTSLIFHAGTLKKYLSSAQTIIDAIQSPWPHLIWVLLVLNDLDHKILLLPYGTNYFVSGTWHNLLFTGEELVRIHFEDYQKLIVALKPCIAGNFYQVLLARSIAHRTDILLKCVIYATYLDPYGKILKTCFQFFPKILGFNNKLYFFIFLILPLLLPRFLRRSVLCFLGFFGARWKKFRILRERILQIREYQKNKAVSQRTFDRSGLGKPTE